MSVKQSAASGFTILELMIAASVFAVILLVVAGGVISFTNDYYKGITSSKTQDVTRSIIDTLTQSIQFGKSVSTGLSGPGGAQGICIDNTLYSYVIGQQVTDTSPNGAIHQAYHGLIADSGGCGAPSVPNSNAALASTRRELLGQHMRLSALSVSSAGTLYTIHVRVIYGDDDLLVPTVGGGTNWANELCGGSITGSQFCAVSDLTTTVKQRL